MIAVEEPLEISEWGLTLNVRALTVRELAQVGARFSVSDLEAEALAWSLAVTEPAFTVDDAREVIETEAFGPTVRVLETICDLTVQAGVAAGVTAGSRWAVALAAKGGRARGAGRRKRGGR